MVDCPRRIRFVQDVQVEAVIKESASLHALALQTSRDDAEWHINHNLFELTIFTKNLNFRFPGVVTLLDATVVKEQMPTIYHYNNNTSYLTLPGPIVEYCP